MSTEIQFTDEVESLEPGHQIERELKGGTGHRYEVDLAAGQYVHLTADQRGIDVVLRLRKPDPDDSLVGEVDSPSFDRGSEQLFAIPQTAGRFRVEVVCGDLSAPAGHYAVRIEPPHPASEAERRHVGAFQLFQEGEALRRKNTTATGRQAVAKYQEALAVWRELGNPEWREWEAESLFEIGVVQQEQLREMDAALASLREALPLLQALARREEEGFALSLCGTIELREGHPQEAIELQEKAVAIFHEIGKPGLEAAALSSLGGAYYAAGEAQKGLDTYRLSLDRAHTAGDVPAEEASALRGIGEILVSQGKLEAAMDSLRQALDVFRRQEALRDAAYALSRMAAISQRLGRLDEALSQLEEALSLLQRIDDKDGEVVALNSLGTVHLLKQETAKAGEVYTRALVLAKSRANRYGEAFSLLNLGRYQFDAGDPHEALRLHEEAAVLFQTIGSRRGEVSTLYGAARALHTLGDDEAARQHLERVISGIETLRDESESQDLRSAYFATKQHYFDLYVDVLMRLHEQNPNAGFDAQALALNERRRARSLLEVLAESRTENQSDANPERTRRRQLQQRINAVEARLENARAAGRETGIVALEKKQSTLLLELADNEAKGRGRNGEFAAATRPQPLALTDMKKLVGAFSLLLVYSLGEERSFLWCLTGDGKLTSHPLPSRKKLEAAAGQVRSAWSRHGGESGAGARQAAWLSHALLGPIAEELGNKRLLIVADGTLQTLPFAALPDPRSLSGNPERL